MVTPEPSWHIAWVPSADPITHAVWQMRLGDEVLRQGVEGGGRGIPIRLEKPDGNVERVFSKKKWHGGCF